MSTASAPEALDGRAPRRAALVHLLPPGGGFRAMCELVERTRSHIAYDVFTVDLGDWNRFADWDSGRLGKSISGAVFEPVRAPAAARRVGRPAEAMLWRAVLAAEQRLAQRINAGGYDLVVAHNNQYFGSSGVLGHLRIPSLYYCQEPRRQSTEYGLDPRRSFDHQPRPLRSVANLAVGAAGDWLRSVDVHHARSATRILCNSTYSSEAIARAYGRVGYVSPLGADLDTFSLSERAREALVVSVGAIDPVKGHRLAIEAVGRIPADRRPRLVIPHERVDPEHLRVLRDLATALGVDLELPRSISDQALNDLYGSATATICAAHLEPLGLSALESIATGTPVVAVNEGGFRETVRAGETGLLVRRDAAALAEAVDSILVGEAVFDPKRLRSAALESFTWQQATDSYLRHVEIVANAAPGRPPEEG